VGGALFLVGQSLSGEERAAAAVGDVVEGEHCALRGLWTCQESRWRARLSGLESSSTPRSSGRIDQ
jgi:hypothetical protein